MNNRKIIIQGLINALGVIIYTSLIAWLIIKGEEIFGKMANFWGPLAFLLVFILSAAIVGLLVFGRPILLYLDGSKKEAVKLLFYTLFWLFLATLVTLLLQLL